MKRFLKAIYFILGLMGGYAAMDFVTGDGDVVHAAIGYLRSDATVDQMLADSPTGAIYRAVKTYYPEEAEAWRGEILAAMKVGRNPDLQIAAALESGSSIRRRLAHTVAFAPDPLLVAVIEEQMRMVAVYEDDANACNRMILQGPAGLTFAERLRLDPLLETAGVSFKAMHAGKTTPVERGPSTEQDWATLFDTLSQSGFPDDHRDLVITPEISDSRLCAAMIGFLDGVAHAVFDGADRIRAELAKSMLEA